MNATSKRPNFLVIVADDLGFSDLGCFGGEIRTPNLDKLAKHGTRFTDFHAAAACSPSRSMIMTGTDNHIAGLGNLIEWTDVRDQNTPKGTKQNTAPQRGMPGYEGYLNERVVAFPEILRDAGYLTLLSGKWHLGLTPERSPKARGFERSYAHLPACSNHYMFEPQLEEEIPSFMTRSYIPLHSRDGIYNHEKPDGWYSSDGYGDIMLQYLKDRKENKDERPFFGYYAFTAPHWPLQAPQEYIQHYRGIYDDGPDALRLRRLEQLRKLGMVDKDVKPHPVVAEELKEWKDYSPEEKAKSSRAMEVFAGMVECIDANVGKVVDYLEQTGELDNTFICFMSDNGAEGAAFEAYPIVQSGVMDHLKKYYNNSLDNLGNFDSFIWYGPRWAQAATAPSRLYKGYTTEGGVRVPFLAKFPNSIGAGNSGGISHSFSTVMDIAPTILEMAGVAHPAPKYQGRDVVSMRGKSMMSYASRKTPSIHEKEFINGWETCGRAAMRKGDWKIDYIPRPKGPERWQLYDLSKDKGETNDLAESHPKKLKEMLKLWDAYVLETGVIPLNPALGEFLEETEAQMPDNAWMEYEYWKDGARDDPEKFTRKPLRFQRKVQPITRQF